MHDEKKWTTLFENLYFFLIMFKNDWYHFKLHINIQWNYFNFKGQIFEIFAMFGHYFMGLCYWRKEDSFVNKCQYIFIPGDGECKFVGTSKWKKKDSPWPGLQTMMINLLCSST